MLEQFRWFGLAKTCVAFFNRKVVVKRNSTRSVRNHHRIFVRKNMNGPSMYRLKPVYEIPQNLDLPDCMYKLKNPAAITVQKSNETIRKDKKMLSSIMDKVNSLMKVYEIFYTALI